MAIEELLSVDVPEDLMPVTTEMLNLITTALAEEGDEAGDSPLLTAVALCVYKLEGQLLAAKVEVLSAHNMMLNLRRYVVDLETRLIEAGIDIDNPSVELEPIEQPFAADD